MKTCAEILKKFILGDMESHRRVFVEESETRMFYRVILYSRMENRLGRGI